MGEKSLRLKAAVFVLGIFIGTTAGAHTGKAPAVHRGKLLSSDIEKMDLQQLLKIDEEMTELWAKLNVARKAKTDIAKEAPFIQAYGMFETIETVRAIQMRMFAELRKGEAEISLPLLEECLNILSAMLTSVPEKPYNEMLGLLDLAEKQFTKPAGMELLAYFDHVVDSARARKEKLVSVRGRIQALMNAPEQVKATLDHMQKKLEERILGQPEVVNALMALEWANQLYKNTRMLPDFIYLMGLPGTGKDTAAEAFTDALWDKDGAHAEHMFRLPIMKGPPELWQVLGSSTGYLGSESFPPFLEFLIRHAGGRYLMQKVESASGKVSWRVIENPEWQGRSLAGFDPPDRAVVFANELHNWSKDNKDTLLKQALEKGYFTINNPNGGLSEIYVPVRFVMASNEGIPLLTSREANGQRYGMPLSYEQMLGKWDKVQTNKDALKNEIMSSNGGVNSKVRGETARGTSEELLNRLQPDRFLLLMRPLSPENLRLIAQGRLREIQARLTQESGFFKSVVLTWSDEMAGFVQGYDYLAEENARPIKGNVEALIQETLLAAVRDGDLPLGRDKRKVAIELSLQKNDDKTVSLVIDYTEDGQKPKQVIKLIQKTEKDRPASALTDEQILRLTTLAEKLKRRVFGIDIIADRIADRVLAIENQRTADTEESRRVSTIVALGLSSTGKTELAKALAAEVLGNEKELMTFDFSQIQTLHDFKTRILGVRDGDGNPIKSDFMKAYDRANGKLFVAFDELANVRDQGLLTALYDFFREPVMNTFSDGIPRKMGGVVVLVTGNAGQELYQNVPRDIPMEQQMAAWEDISTKVALDMELQRKILERYFPAPLVTRWSKNNVFFFPPHTFKSLRQLAQLKLDKELERLAVSQSRRGWNVVVPDQEEYGKLIDAVVEEGFSLRYQGASIDSFILEDLGEALESVLLKNLVPSGSTVVLKLVGKTPNDDEEKPGAVQFKVFVEGSAAPLDFAFKRPYVPKPRKESEQEQRITAYHEAGHSIIRQVFFSAHSKPGMISIIPGVTEINNEWVVYAGIAQSEDVGTPHYDRGYIVQNIAVLAAGETAERLVTQGESHTVGKSNDMKRATKLAQDAILRFGLSEAWGTLAIPAGMSMGEYLSSLSEKQKQLLERETRKLIEEGQALARQYLEANFANALIPLGNMLIENGKVETEEMVAFYDRVTLNRKAPAAKFSPFAAVRKWMTRPAANAASGQIRSDIVAPQQVANISSIVEARKRRQFKEVPVPEKLPLGSNPAFAAWAKGSGLCETLLKKAS